MKIVKVDLKERSYKIYVGCKLDWVGSKLKKYRLGKKILVVTNPVVEKFYLKKIVKFLKKANYEVYTCRIPDGERYKSLQEASSIYDVCIEKELDRQSTILALGGGVIGDLAGFVASTIFRGVSFIQVPTTLLAQVDASIGGKVGVNHPKGKNLIGSFYQPQGVFIDLTVLKSLPKCELAVGLAEIIKYGVINDSHLFSYLEENIQRVKKLDLVCLEYVIRRACEIKAFIVERDEKEKGLRRILNYGHTAGHVLESMRGYEGYRHGEAVSIGMVVANKIAQRLGILKEKDSERIRKLIEIADLPTKVKGRLDINEFMKILRLDKKVLAGKVNFILPTKIGKVVIRNDVPEKVVREVLRNICEKNGG